MRQVTSAVLTVFFAVNLAMAQDAGMGTGAKRNKRSTTASPSVSAQLSQMQKSIEAQQQQIQQLMQQLQSRDQEVQRLQEQMNQVQSTASQAQQKADTAAAQSNAQQKDVGAVRSDVSDLKDTVTNTALAVQETQKTANEALALRIKGITLTPGGFLAAETVWRQRGSASDVNTPFNAIPMPGSSQSNLSQFFGSGRQSRISLLAEGKLKSAKLTGYFETDFLSSGITSNNNESNSYAIGSGKCGDKPRCMTGVLPQVKCGAWSRRPEKAWITAPRLCR